MHQVWLLWIYFFLVDFHFLQSKTYFPANQWPSIKAIPTYLFKIPSLAIQLQQWIQRIFQSTQRRKDTETLSGVAWHCPRRRMLWKSHQNEIELVTRPAVRKETSCLRRKTTLWYFETPHSRGCGTSRTPSTCCLRLTSKSEWRPPCPTRTRGISTATPCFSASFMTLSMRSCTRRASPEWVTACRHGDTESHSPSVVTITNRRAPYGNLMPFLHLTQ